MKPRQAAASRGVARRQEAVHELVAHAAVLAPRILRALGERPPGGGAELLPRLIENRMRALLEADDGHRRALRAERRARRRRDEAAADAGAGLRRLKVILDCSYGPSAAERLVGLGRVPRRPVEVWQQGRSVLGLLRRPDVTWPQALPDAGAPRLELLAGGLERALERLDSALRQLCSEQLRTRLTRHARRLAINAVDRQLAYCGRFLASFCDLAGLRAEADHVRRGRSRSRRGKGRAGQASVDLRQLGAVVAAVVVGR